jgi:phage-related protein
VVEVAEDFRGDTFRAVYTVKYADGVYVLHAFQKNSKVGARRLVGTWNLSSSDCARPNG